MESCWCRSGSTATTTVARRSATPGPMTMTRPTDTTDATPATTFSTATSSTRRTSPSSDAQMPSPPAFCTTRIPTPPSTSTAAPVSGRRWRSTTSCRWRWLGTWGPTTGPLPNGSASPTIPPTCWRCPARLTKTKATYSRRCGCHPTTRSGASTRCSTSRCRAGMRSPSTRLRPMHCVTPRPPAHRVTS